MPESDGRHVLVRETVDGVPQYSWTTATVFVKVNNATLFEHTPSTTQPFNNTWQFQLPAGLYLVTTTITCYNENDALFNDCDSIESVVNKGYKVSVSLDGTPLLDLPFIDTLNNLVTTSDTKLINGTGWTGNGETESPGGTTHTITATTNIPSLVCLGGVKSITIAFESLVES